MNDKLKTILLGALRSACGTGSFLKRSLDFLESERLVVALARRVNRRRHSILELKQGHRSIGTKVILQADEALLHQVSLLGKPRMSRQRAITLAAVVMLVTAPTSAQPVLAQTCVREDPNTPGSRALNWLWNSDWSNEHPIVASFLLGLNQYQLPGPMALTAPSSNFIGPFRLPNSVTTNFGTGEITTRLPPNPPLTRLPSRFQQEEAAVTQAFNAMLDTYEANLPQTIANRLAYDQRVAEWLKANPQACVPPVPKPLNALKPPSGSGEGGIQVYCPKPNQIGHFSFLDDPECPPPGPTLIPGCGEGTDNSTCPLPPGCGPETDDSTCGGGAGPGGETSPPSPGDVWDRRDEFEWARRACLDGYWGGDMCWNTDGYYCTNECHI